MRKLSLPFMAAIVMVVMLLATTSLAQDTRTLTVTAVTHDARVNERTSYHTKAGQSTTDCSGTGSDPANTGTVRINMDCNTSTTPPTTSSITTRTTDVSERVIDSDNAIYTIVCTDRPSILAGAIAGAAAGAGGSGNTNLSGRGNCVPLIDGDHFDAEIKGTTMWVHARKGGNQGKAVKIKYRILDIRKLPPPQQSHAPSPANLAATTSTGNCDVNEVWSLGRKLGEKDSEILDAIEQHGVCKVLFFLHEEADGRKVTSASSMPSPLLSTTDTYAGVGGGHWISEVSKNGAIVTLEDGSLWDISAPDRIDTALWLPTTSITVLENRSTVGDSRYTLVNKDDGEKAMAKYIGKG